MREYMILAIINFCVVVVYFIWNKCAKKEKAIGYWAKSIVMLLCPLLGPVFIGLSYLLHRFVLTQEVDLEDVVFAKDRVKTYMHADEERGRTMVPMEEALAITDRENLRNLMLNIVRTDIRESLESISLALNSEDSETAHYAASVLQDALNDFRATVQKYYRHIQKKDENQLEYVLLLLDYMNQVLRQKVFTDMEQKAFVMRMDEISEILFEDYGDRMTSEHYEMVSLRLLEIREYENCKKWCERAVMQYPKSLSTYTCQLKLYFSNGNREEFFRVLSELRSTNIVIDNETLEMIRVFQ